MFTSGTFRTLTSYVRVKISETETQQKIMVNRVWKDIAAEIFVLCLKKVESKPRLQSCSNSSIFFNLSRNGYEAIHSLFDSVIKVETGDQQNETKTKIFLKRGNHNG